MPNTQDVKVLLENCECSYQIEIVVNPINRLEQCAQNLKQRYQNNRILSSQVLDPFTRYRKIGPRDDVKLPKTSHC